MLKTDKTAPQKPKRKSKLKIFLIAIIAAVAGMLIFDHVLLTASTAFTKFKPEDIAGNSYMEPILMSSTGVPMTIRINSTILCTITTNSATSDLNSDFKFNGKYTIEDNILKITSKYGTEYFEIRVGSLKYLGNQSDRNLGSRGANVYPNCVFKQVAPSYAPLRNLFILACPAAYVITVLLQNRQKDGNNVKNTAKKNDRQTSTIT